MAAPLRLSVQLNPVGYLKLACQGRHHEVLTRETDSAASKPPTTIFRFPPKFLPLYFKSNDKSKNDVTKFSLEHLCFCEGVQSRISDLGGRIPVPQRRRRPCRISTETVWLHQNTQREFRDKVDYDQPPTQHCPRCPNRALHGHDQVACMGTTWANPRRWLAYET